MSLWRRRSRWGTIWDIRRLVIRGRRCSTGSQRGVRALSAECPYCGGAGAEGAGAEPDLGGSQWDPEPPTSGHPATLEGNVVRLSDKIAYINHDIDDAIRGKIMKEEDLPREYTDILGNSVHERLNIMIHDIIEHSQDKPEVAMSPEREEAMHGLRRWMFDHVYHDGIAKAEEGRAQQMIEMLYGYYMAHPEELPEESHRIMEMRNETKERAVCDYIAGMTDIYAIDRFKELFIPKAWSLYKEEEMYYPEEVIEEVRMRSDIVDVISWIREAAEEGKQPVWTLPVSS